MEQTINNNQFIGDGMNAFERNVKRSVDCFLELPHTGHTGIRISFVESWTEFLCIQPHTSELVNVKRTTETTDALLLENYRCPILLSNTSGGYFICYALQWLYRYAGKNAPSFTLRLILFGTSFMVVRF